MRLRPSIHLTLLACSALLHPTGSFGAEFAGATLREVRAELGEPRALLKHDSVAIAHYDTRRITFRDGVAVEEVAIDPEERESQREMLQRVAQEKREVGQRLYERYQASGELQHLSPDARLEFWQAFQRKYPEVELGDMLAEAREDVERYRAMQRQAEQEAQIAYLSDRVDYLESRYSRLRHYADGDGFRPWGQPRFGHGKWWHHKKRHRDRDTDAPPPSNDANRLPVHRAPGGSLQGHDSVFQISRGVDPIISKP